MKTPLVPLTYPEITVLFCALAEYRDSFEEAWIATHAADYALMNRLVARLDALMLRRDEESPTPLPSA